MHTKRFLPAIFSFILLIYFSFSCKDKNCPGSLAYQLPISPTPQKDTFNIGDTLWLSLNIPKELIDEQGGIKNTFEDFDFKLYVISSRYDSIQKYSTKTFNLDSHVGADSIYRYSSFDEYGLILDYDGATYQYQGYIRLKESGVFAIYFGTRYDVRLNPVEFNGNCDHLNVHLFPITNDGENNNIELLKPYFGGNPENWDSDFRKSGGFAFVVR